MTTRTQDHAAAIAHPGIPVYAWKWETEAIASYPFKIIKDLP